jgi:hypothetical protein
VSLAAVSTSIQFPVMSSSVESEQGGPCSIQPFEEDDMNQFPFSLLFLQPARTAFQCRSTCQKLLHVRLHPQGEYAVTTRAHFSYIEIREPDIKPIPPTRPIPQSAQKSFAPPPPGPPSIENSPEHLIDVRLVTQDRAEVRQDRAEDPPSVEVVDDIRVPLLAYGRTIIQLAIDHRPDQAQALAEAISSSRLAVTSYREDIVKDLQMDLRVKTEQIRQLQDTNDELEETGMVREGELRRELLREKAERERLERAWDEDAENREEYKEMKDESKRKRQRMMETWGKGEGLAAQLVLTGHQFL